MGSGASVVVVGGGPAGLGAGYELVQSDVPVLVLEGGEQVGGICRTLEGDGYYVDIGGHRFITKIDEVLSTWKSLLGDDLLVRERMTRIFFRNELMPYPLELGPTFRTLGMADSALALLSYVHARLRPLPEDSFENWVTNHFGRRVYQHFFKTYTEKVWGTPCTELSADWAAQRIRALSLWEAIKDAFRGALQPDVERDADEALLHQFYYPRLGPGIMFDRYAEEIEAAGSEVRTQHQVVRVIHQDGRVREVISTGPGGEQSHEGESFLSSMPLAELPKMMDPAPPEEVLEAANRLRHRSFLTAALLLDEPSSFPDTWIYVHSPDVLMGRVQNYLNWSPHMVEGEGRCCIAAEYFAWQGDDLWERSDEELSELAREELGQVGLIDPEKMLDSTVARIPYAYPIYDSDYGDHIGTIRNWLEGLENLQSIGRSGQHRYINMDFAVMTGIEAARNILGADHDTWRIGTEDEYLEEKPS